MARRGASRTTGPSRRLCPMAPAILLVWDTVRRSRRALVWLGIGIAIYVAWAVLLDAAIHGWDDLKLLPSPTR